MDDKDHVFARFKVDKTAHSDRRETLTIPRRAGAPGSRSVEVVHVRSGGAVRDRPQRQDLYVRAASWYGGFPTRQTVRTSTPIEPLAAEVAQPVTHVMPAWEPAAEADAAAAAAPAATLRRGRGRPRKQPASAPPRRVADPYNASDNGANCMRCGYAIEPAREKCGLMTCFACR